MTDYSKMSAFVKDETIDEIAEAASEMGVDYHAVVQVALELVMDQYQFSSITRELLLQKVRRANKEVEKVLY